MLLLHKASTIFDFILFLLFIQVVPAKEGLLQELAEKLVDKDEPGLRRLINESEEIAAHREQLKKRLVLLQRASKEIAAFM